MSDTKAILIIIPLLLLLIFLAMGLGKSLQWEEFSNQAIERGYALHCPVTGDFAWKGECDD